MSRPQHGDPEIDATFRNAIMIGTREALRAAFKKYNDDVQKICMNLDKELLVELYVLTKSFGANEPFSNEIKDYIKIRYRQGGKSDSYVDAMLERKMTEPKPPTLF